MVLTWAPAALLAAATLAAYANSFHAPFVFDDNVNVVGNLTIRHLSTALRPRPDSVTGGRALLNLSFAINYALGALNVRGYHVVNLAIHFAAALALFGILRRTLFGQILPAASRHLAGPIALSTALIWSVHPLQTEAVTYISQRAESLMGLLYLLTFYCFVRSTDSKVPVRWLTASVLLCFAGTLVKELIATAPIVILFYDRLFVGRSFQVIWRQRRYYYFGLLGNLVLLAFIQSGLHREGVGFQNGVTSWVFAMYSGRTICRYIKLAFWPHPLVLDYGDIPRFMLIQGFLPYDLVIIGILAVALFRLQKRPASSFVLLAFLLVLAPSHSVIPLATQPMAEHRIYLGLSMLMVLPVAGLYLCLGNRANVAVAMIVLLFIGMTFSRNRDYSSVVCAWSDVVKKFPENPRGHYALGGAYYLVGRYADAQAELERTIVMVPDFLDAYTDLGLIYSGRPDDIPKAVNLFRRVIQKDPGDVRVHILLGLALKKTLGGEAEAIQQFRTAIKLGKDHPDGSLPFAYTALADLLQTKPGKKDEALALYRTALELAPENLDASIGVKLLTSFDPQTRDAIAERLRAVIRENPGSRDDRYNLAQILSTTPEGRSEAISEYEAVLRIDPNFAEAHSNLGILLAASAERLTEAIEQFKLAIQDNPNLAIAYFNLGRVLSESPENHDESVTAYENAVRLEPGYAQAHNNLGIALAEDPLRLSDAISQFKEALQIDPGYQDAKENLEIAQKQEGSAPAQSPVPNHR